MTNTMAANFSLKFKIYTVRYCFILSQALQKEHCL